MKLSKREKVLIFILIIVIIGYFCYKRIPSSGLFNLNTLKEEYDVKSNDYRTMSQNIVLKTKYEEKIQVLTEEINNLNFISDLQQEKLIVFLNSYLANNNIDANNISFTDTTIVPVNLNSESDRHKDKSTFENTMDEINNGSLINQNRESNDNGNAEQKTNSDEIEAAQEDNQDSLQNAVTVKAITASITFQSTYENMIKFIGAIQNQPYDILITNINTVTVASDAGNIVQGNMELIFYEVPKLDSFIEQNEDWIW